MKTEQLIVQYLYYNKKLSLQEIGTFAISPEINIDPQSDKDFALPPDSIQFHFDPKAEVDDGLVQYISDHSRKMRALAASDLESFIILNKQFLNIGKPLIMVGLGTLQKAQTGEYAFTQATSSHVIHEESPKQITEKEKEKISFVTPPRVKSTGKGKPLAGIILLIVALGAAFAAYYFINKNKEKNSEVTEGISSVAYDSASNKKDSSAPKKVIKDSTGFYVVINQYPDFASAEKRAKVLMGYGHKVSVRTTDSSTFKVSIPFMLPVSDTIRTRDSIAKLLSPKAYIELP